MIVFWRDHFRSLLAGLRQAEEACNLAEGVTVGLDEVKDAPTEFIL